MSSIRRRQTRLAFTPLPSSSPAAKDYPQQIRERAAAVTLDGSPSQVKRRKMTAVTADSACENVSILPTPIATNDGAGDSDSDDDPIPSSKRRASSQIFGRKGSRQQRLDLGSDSSPGKTGRVSGSAINVDSPMEATGRQSRDKHSDGDSSDELPSPGKLMKTKSRKTKMPMSKGRITRSSQKVHANLDESDAEEEPRSATGIIDLSDNNDDDEDMPTTTGKQKVKRRRQTSKDDFIVSSSPPQAVESDDDLQIISPPKRSKRGVQISNEEEASQDDDEPITPRRRKPLQLERKLSQRDKHDLKDDLEFLGPSSDVDEDGVRPKRTTQSVQKTARQKALEALKRKRAGQDVNEEEEEDEDEERVVENDVDSAAADEDVFADEDEFEESAPPPTSTLDMFTREQEDEEFLVEDDDNDPLGVPAGIPLAYTRYASMKANKLFKYAVEWMVQKKINPAFQSDDEIYALSFRKLDDEVKGLAGSKFTSGAWTADFTRSLQARPGVAYGRIDNSSDEYLRNKCDACNRSNHPATWEIQFQEKPYDRHTLEPVGGDTDDSESDSDNNDSHENEEDPNDKPDWDACGLEIPSPNTVYYIGRFCMSNARTAHILTHWRYHLNKWVIDWLDNQGYNSADKVVERDRWSTKKRRKYANKIFDVMEKGGTVRELYDSYNSERNEARGSKQGRWTVDSP